MLGMLVPSWQTLPKKTWIICRVKFYSTHFLIEPFPFWLFIKWQTFHGALILGRSECIGARPQLCFQYKVGFVKTYASNERHCNRLDSHFLLSFRFVGVKRATDSSQNVRWMKLPRNGVTTGQHSKSFFTNNALKNWHSNSTLKLNKHRFWNLSRNGRFFHWNWTRP